MTTAVTEQNSASSSLMPLITGFWIFQAIYSAVSLNIPDALKSGPLSSKEVSAETGANPDSLYRLMRALSSLGIFSELPDQRFEHTPLSEVLCSDHPESLHPMVKMLGQTNYQAWGCLAEGIKTGRNPFELAFGMTAYDYFFKHPEVGETFNQAMAAIARKDQPGIIAAYDFSQFNTIIDIGGGNGMLLAGILRVFPSLSGILFELPQVIDEARDYLQKMAVHDRCQLVAGDFFKSIPQGGDAYLLSRIIHTFNDEQCLTILGNIHQVIPDKGKLLLIEDVLDPGHSPATAGTKFMDLNMLVFAPGGREHTQEEFDALLEKSGFKLSRIFPTASGISIIEALKR